ncbi:N-acetylmuramic acid 6-phosphate etherase family protein [Fodinicola feengrottensis]|uniref:hypothetical protein n=1 Tax=Fodinicola feengrottensis TaxID=435914 RepID=UPI0024424E03|nr:hypothetical protein [Fodinicola feengrottensis]
MTAAPRIAPEAVSFASPTELRNPRTVEIDRLDTLDVLRMINEEDSTVANAVAAVLPQLARAVDYAVASLRAGHRVHYVGAGTSGRLGALDAAELLPTFALEPGRGWSRTLPAVRRPCCAPSKRSRTTRPPVAPTWPAWSPETW